MVSHICSLSSTHLPRSLHEMCLCCCEHNADGSTSILGSALTIWHLAVANLLHYLGSTECTYLYHSNSTYVLWSYMIHVCTTATSPTFCGTTCHISVPQQLHLRSVELHDNVCTTATPSKFCGATCHISVPQQLHLRSVELHDNVCTTATPSKFCGAT